MRLMDTDLVPPPLEDDPSTPPPSPILFPSKLLLLMFLLDGVGGEGTHQSNPTAAL